MKPFREIPKENMELRVPIKIADRIRSAAAEQRRSLSEVSSEILARGLDIDPAECGIRPTPATVTS
jgi:hypothetical protein